MATTVIVFALLAALSNAVNEATQHVASIAAPRRSSGWRLVVYLFRNPLWLFGWVSLAGAFVFQALALHNGEISVVQPLLATELVLMLVLRRFWINQAIRPITWAAAAVTCIGLVAFIVAGQPGGGQPTPISHHWVTAALACCAGAAVMSVLARWGSPSLRAALYASAAAVMWALAPTLSSGELRIPRRTGGYANGRTIPTTRVIPAASASQLKGAAGTLVSRNRSCSSPAWCEG